MANRSKAGIDKSVIWRSKNIADEECVFVCQECRSCLARSHSEEQFGRRQEVRLSWEGRYAAEKVKLAVNVLHQTIIGRFAQRYRMNPLSKVSM
jgi:hypothetical protein